MAVAGCRGRCSGAAASQRWRGRAPSCRAASSASASASARRDLLAASRGTSGWCRHFTFSSSSPHSEESKPVAQPPSSFPSAPKLSISPLEIARLPPLRFPGRVIVIGAVEDEQRVESLFQDQALLGFDSESRPSSALAPKNRLTVAVVDMRTLHTFEEWHIRGSTHVPFTEIKQRGFELPPRSVPLLCVCEEEEDLSAGSSGRLMNFWMSLTAPPLRWAPLAASAALRATLEEGDCLGKGPMAKGRFLFQACPLLCDEISSGSENARQGSVADMIETAKSFSDPLDPRRPFAVDVGCGSGRDTAILLSAGFFVLALDRDARGLKRLNAMAERHDLAGRLKTRASKLSSSGVAKLLKPGTGILLYHQFLEGNIHPTGEEHALYLVLKSGELARLFGHECDILRDEELAIEEGRSNQADGQRCLTGSALQGIPWRPLMAIALEWGLRRPLLLPPAAACLSRPGIDGKGDAECRASAGTSQEGAAGFTPTTEECLTLALAAIGQCSPTLLTKIMEASAIISAGLATSSNAAPPRSNPCDDTVSRAPQDRPAENADVREVICGASSFRAAASDLSVSMKADTQMILQALADLRIDEAEGVDETEDLALRSHGGNTVSQHSAFAQVERRASHGSKNAFALETEANLNSPPRAAKKARKPENLTAMLTLSISCPLSSQPKPGMDLDRSTLETCQSVTALALGMVMAGTGDLASLCILRSLRKKAAQETGYGVHMATHMALGWVCLGGGRYTFDQEPLSIAALLMAAFPRLPTSLTDNRCHLQAFRHLYVLSARHRCVEAIEVDTKQPVDVHVSLETLGGTETTSLPRLMLTSGELKSITLRSERYWPVTIRRAAAGDGPASGRWMKALEASRRLYVKRRSGHLPHRIDSQGAQGAGQAWFPSFIAPELSHLERLLQVPKASGASPASGMVGGLMLSWLQHAGAEGGGGPLEPGTLALSAAEW
ncbi:unnamed protein product, partial [Polarella glacialis]